MSSAGTERSKTASSIAYLMLQLGGLKGLWNGWNDFPGVICLELPLLADSPFSFLESQGLSLSTWPLQLVLLTGQTDFVYGNSGLQRAKSKHCQAFLRLRPKLAQPFFCLTKADLEQPRFEGGGYTVIWIRGGVIHWGHQYNGLPHNLLELAKEMDSISHF